MTRGSTWTTENNKRNKGAAYSTDDPRWRPFASKLYPVSINQAVRKRLIRPSFKNGAYLKTPGRVVPIPEGSLASDPEKESSRLGERVQLKTWFENAHRDVVVERTGLREREAYNTREEVLFCMEGHMSESELLVPQSSFSNDEIAALKALAGKMPKPWWRDYPFLVSLCAFALALITSLISAYEGHLRDMHDRQSQLSADVATLQRLNVESIEAHVKYQNTPYENVSSGFINNEIGSTLHSAEKIALQLGDQASTADLVAIAEGLYGLGEYESTEKLLKYALKASETASDESIALRDLGIYAIRSKKTDGVLKEGNDYFEQALTLDRKYGISDQPVAVAWLRSTALLTWAGALASVGHCVDAQNRFAEGVQILRTAPDTLDFQRSKNMTRQQWTTGIGGIPNCMPNTETAPL